jgi:two-component system sensor histidine kinase AlgZ
MEKNGKIINDNLFLPNFCRSRLLLLAILIAQLLTLVLIISPLGERGDKVVNEGFIYYLYNLRSYEWKEMLQLSLFIQAVVLCSAFSLCFIRRWLCKFNDRIVAISSYFIILSITWALSEIAWYFIFAPYQVTNTGIVNHNLGITIQGIGDFSMNKKHYHTFMFRNISISAIMSWLILHYLYIQYQWRNKVNAEAQARLQSLQSRINPHFLFNCMNTIASLVRIDANLAEQAVEDLADLFRASLIDARNLVTLEEELSLCRQYLRIENLRLGERLRIIWVIDILPLDALVPSLCLQPLLENAIHYGIQPSIDGGAVTITGLFDGKHIKIDIENPLPINEQNSPIKKHKGNHIAQENLKQRLHVYYKSDGRLDTYYENNNYRASLHFPYLLEYSQQDF